MPTGKLVLFDLGGVLVEYDHQKTLAELAAIYKFTFEQVRQLTSGDISRQLGTGELGANAFYQLLVEESGAFSEYARYFEAFTAGMARDQSALAYALSLTHRADVQVGIISNTNEAHAEWLRANLHEFQHFYPVILSNEVGLVKPDPQIYWQALAPYQIEPHQAIFVDDLVENVRGAEAVGMAGIVHENWADSQPQLEQWLAIT